jgi:DNA polymerase-3 subunit delta'
VTCKQFDKLQHPNLKLVFALPRGKSERSDESPILALTDSDIRIIQDQLRLKGENPFHQIQIPRANEIRINSIRELRRDAGLSAFASGWKVFIILDADKMNDEASNALLKTLEEPTQQTVLVLTTSKREKLLPTILSRCQPVKLDPLSAADIRDALITRYSVPEDQAQLVATLSNGNFSRALELLQADLHERRNAVVDFVRTALSNRPTKLFQQIEELTAVSERVEHERWLSLMLLWFRDAAALREGNHSGLVNVDQLDALRGFVAKFPQANLPRVISTIEEAIALIGKNVYLPLVFANLAFQLRDAIAVGRKEALVENKAP